MICWCFNKNIAFQSKEREKYKEGDKYQRKTIKWHSFVEPEEFTIVLLSANRIVNRACGITHNSGNSYLRKISLPFSQIVSGLRERLKPKE